MKSRENLDPLSDADFSLCEKLMDYLREMKAITTVLCSEISPAVSLIMPLLTDRTQNKLKPPTRDLIDAEKTERNETNHEK